METVTLLIYTNTGQEFISRAFKNWRDAQKTADSFNEIILKEGLVGLYVTKTLVVK